MRVLVVLGILVALAGSAPAAAGPAADAEQDVHPLTPTVEQRIEVLTPTAEQHVQMVDAQGVQQTIAGNATDSAPTRAAKVVGKVVLTVVGASVSCAMMVAALLFI